MTRVYTMSMATQLRGASAQAQHPTLASGIPDSNTISGRVGSGFSVWSSRILRRLARLTPAIEEDHSQ